MTITDDEESKPNSSLQVAAMILLIIIAIFSFGVSVGVISAFFSDNEAELSGTFIALLTTSIVIAAASAYSALRLYKQRVTTMGEPTQKEKINRNILFASGIFGGVIGMVLVLNAPELGEDPLAVFSDAPLPPLLAAVLAAFWGLIMPVVSYYWHAKATDEQERYVVGRAAIWALYFYMIAAPLWWLLWRGGFVPAINGTAIYMLTILIFMTIWVKEKYL